MSTNISYTSRVTVGVGNLDNIYKPKPTPPNVNSLPVYINDELQSLGGSLNSILQGGVFPVVSELPLRFKEGTCFLFRNSVSVDGEIVIPSSGLYLFFEGKWKKIQLTDV